MRYLIPLTLIAIAALGYSLTAWAADSGLVAAGAGANDASVGTQAWTNPENVTADDASIAFVTCHTVSANAENSVRLFVAGVPVGDNKSTGTTWPSGDLTHGGASDTWGLTPTPAEINASDFGIGYSVSGNLCTSQYLLASDFGFAIPDGATIDGIETVVEASQASAQARADFIEMKIYYTEASNPAASATIRTSSVQIRSGTMQVR